MSEPVIWMRPFSNVRESPDCSNGRGPSCAEYFCSRESAIAPASFAGPPADPVPVVPPVGPVAPEELEELALPESGVAIGTQMT
jgi:hypothetical protein